MSFWPKTIGFAAVQVSFTTLIHLWCQAVRARFHAEHPEGNGAVIANICWDYSWVGIAVAVLLSAMLVFARVRKLETLYATTYYFGIWLLVVWFGATLVAGEIAFVPWHDLRGPHY